MFTEVLQQTQRRRCALPHALGLPVDSKQHKGRSSMAPLHSFIHPTDRPTRQTLCSLELHASTHAPVVKMQCVCVCACVCVCGFRLCACVCVFSFRLFKVVVLVQLLRPGVLLATCNTACRVFTVARRRQQECEGRRGERCGGWSVLAGLPPCHTHTHAHITYSLTNSRTHELTNSRTHELTNSRTHSRSLANTHTLAHSHTRTLAHSHATWRANSSQTKAGSTLTHSHRSRAQTAVERVWVGE